MPLVNSTCLCLCKQTPLTALVIICGALWVNEAEASAVAGRVELNELVLLTEHAEPRLGGLSAHVHFKLQLRHIVKRLWTWGKKHTASPLHSCCFSWSLSQSDRWKTCSLPSRQLEKQRSTLPSSVCKEILTALHCTMTCVSGTVWVQLYLMRVSGQQIRWSRSVGGPSAWWPDTWPKLFHKEPICKNRWTMITLNLRHNQSVQSILGHLCIWKEHFLNKDFKGIVCLQSVTWHTRNNVQTCNFNWLWDSWDPADEYQLLNGYDFFMADSWCFIGLSDTYGVKTRSHRTITITILVSTAAHCSRFKWSSS